MKKFSAITVLFIVAILCCAQTGTQIDIQKRMKNVPGGNGAILFNNSGSVGGSAATISADGQINDSGNYSGYSRLSNSFFQIYPTFTGAASSGNEWGLYTGVSVIPTGASSINYIAGKDILALGSSYAITSNNYSAAHESQVLQQGTGTVALMIGHNITSASFWSAPQPASSNAGLITDNEGLRVTTGSGFENVNGGPITNDYSINIQSPGTTALVSNHYGLYIQDQTIGGANNPNPYGIYEVAGKNFFGGPSTFASSATAATLIESSSSSPTSAGTAGTTGQIAWDANYVYICTQGGPAGSATWKKAALGSD